MTEDRAFWNAAIAHELRTPVTVLRGRLQGLADGVFPPDERQFRRLLAQVEGLARLVEDLRAISLAESGHLDLRWQACELAHELGDVVDAFRPALAEGGQRLTLDAPTMTVWCDPVRIRQVLAALLDNAQRYAHAGAVHVLAALREGRCVLCVEDAGPGLAPDMRAQVFEAFRRAGQTRDVRERSSGLGLAVVAAIAHAHGGAVVCRDSALGGCCFEFSWPAGRRPEPLVADAVSAQGAPGSAWGREGGPTSARAARW
jgi:two-component system sensor histidine kinase AdeS